MLCSAKVTAIKVKMQVIYLFYKYLCDQLTQWKNQVDWCIPEHTICVVKTR